MGKRKRSKRNGWAITPQKKGKWAHGDEVVQWANDCLLPIHIFERSTATPHIRIMNRVDYWPASTRFYDIDSRTRGVGFDRLKEHLFNLVVIASTKFNHDEIAV